MATGECPLKQAAIYDAMRNWGFTGHSFNSTGGTRLDRASKFSFLFPNSELAIYGSHLSHGIYFFGVTGPEPMPRHTPCLEPSNMVLPTGPSSRCSSDALFWLLRRASFCRISVSCLRIFRSFPFLVAFPLLFSPLPGSVSRAHQTSRPAESLAHQVNTNPCHRTSQALTHIGSSLRSFRAAPR